MSSDYQLLNFGGNEKLESFGGTLVQRQTPSVSGVTPGEWQKADIRFRLDNYSGESHVKGTWSGEIQSGDHRSDWQAKICDLVFSLRQTPTGQIGVFPEQANNWNWIGELPDRMRGMKALNLFAYTGGTTMALARKGVEVVHVDSAKSVVNWARENAKLSGLADAPIRWIVEDVMTFVNREIKRGNKYDIVVADPPSFGRGPKRELWRIQSDFQLLMSRLSELTDAQPNLALFSCHTQGFDHQMLEQMSSKSFDKSVKAKSSNEYFELALESVSGRLLPSGSCVRWNDF